jgi:putative hemolysin
MLAAILRQAMPLIPDLPRPAFRQRAVHRRRTVVDFTVRNYQVKTVDSAQELRQVLALRRTVFHHEFAGRWLSLKSDKDAFDDEADHLAIFDRRAGKIAGVYRLITSQAGRPFYSATEFDIAGLLALPGRKVELSRACIARPYRNGIVIALLWRGLAEYAKAAGADYLFGLSSINTVDPFAIAKVHTHFLSAGLVDFSFGTAPTRKFRIQGFQETLAAVAHDAMAEEDGEALVPSLLKTYIKAGAKICSQPVIDRDFNCADWLTVLDMRQLREAYGRKFMRV